MKKRTTFFASIGSAIEYFDFVVYALLASQLGAIFFPSKETLYLQTFIVFSIGYIARPIGGLALGLIGDLLGRKRGFSLSILLMAISTLLISILPGYRSWGVLAPMLLVFCRFVQGISFGAELPGAITLLSESEKSKKKSGICSFAISSASIGSILASSLLLLLSTFMDTKMMQMIGWRIPFLLGGTAALLTFFARRSLNQEEERGTVGFSFPVRSLLASHFPSLLLGTLAMIFPASLVIGNLYLYKFLASHSNHSFADISLALTIGLVWSVFVVPLFGFLADRVGRRFLFCISILSLGVIGIPLLSYLFSHQLILFALLYQTFVSAAMSSFFPFLTELFPKSVRYTGVALCYNMAFVIASLVPLLFEHFLRSYPYPFILFTILSLIGSVSFIAAISTFFWQKKVLLRVKIDN